MALDDRKIWAETHRDLPGTLYTEGSTAPLRGSSRGELFVQALAGGRMHALANEGSYFVATNPTPGTGIAGIAASDGFDDLETFLFLRNNDVIGNPQSKRIFLDFIRLQATAAGTNGTNFSAVAKIDTGNSRYTSGGSLLTPVNPNMDSSAATISQLRAGALVTTAASSQARLLFSGLMRSVIKVVGDVYFFDFGASARSLSSMIVAGTAIANVVIPMPPVILGPGQTFFLHEFAASQTVAASYELQIGWWER